jgi:hypothetical protein
MVTVHDMGEHGMIAQRGRDQSAVTSSAGIVGRNGREGYGPHWATWGVEENRKGWAMKRVWPMRLGKERKCFPNFGFLFQTNSIQIQTIVKRIQILTHSTVRK